MGSLPFSGVPLLGSLEFPLIVSGTPIFRNTYINSTPFLPPQKRSSKQTSLQWLQRWPLQAQHRYRALVSTNPNVAPWQGWHTLGISSLYGYGLCKGTPTPQNSRKFQVQETLHFRYMKLLVRGKIFVLFLHVSAR